MMNSRRSPVGALRVHGNQLALTSAHLLHDRADCIGRNVRDHALHRLTGLAVDLLEQRLRCADLELIALTAQVLDQDGQVHLTAAANAECVGGVGFVYAQGYVLEQLTGTDAHAGGGGDKLAFLAGERRVVDHKGHLNGRLGNLNERQSLNVLRIAQGLTDGYALRCRRKQTISPACASSIG